MCIYIYIYTYIYIYIYIYSNLFLTAAEVHIRNLLEYIKHQQEQLIAKVNYLTSKNPAGQEMERPVPVQFPLGSMEEVERPVPVQFPLGSMEEVENFEDWLKDSANSQLKQRVVSFFVCLFCYHVNPI